MRSQLTPDFVAVAAQLACLLEVSAAKPGNVSPGCHFGDARYEDFLASAVAIGEPLGLAGARPVGPTVLAAVEATARWAPSNTNLGIILLLAPLARAALRHGGSDTKGLREGVDAVLAATTVSDAQDVYAAIRLVRPGGLGRAPAQDLADEPTATLRDVMALAAHRDSIASEYASAFSTTFEVAVPALARARRDGLSWDAATIETYLTLLATHADSLIARKLGAETAAGVRQQAKRAVDAGGVRTPEGRSRVAALDRSLRDPGNATNPGTTADLTAAALFVVLLTGGWGRAL